MGSCTSIPSTAKTPPSGNASGNIKSTRPVAKNDLCGRDDTAVYIIPATRTFSRQNRVTPLGPTLTPTLSVGEMSLGASNQSNLSASETYGSTDVPGLGSPGTRVKWSSHWRDSTLRSDWSNVVDCLSNKSLLDSTNYCRESGRFGFALDDFRCKSQVRFSLVYDDLSMRNNTSTGCDRVLEETTTDDHTESRSIHQSKELVEVSSDSQEIYDRNPTTIQQLHQRLKDMTKERDNALLESERLTNENKSLGKKVVTWKGKHKCEKRNKSELVMKIVSRAREQQDEWKGKHADIGRLNEELSVNVSQLTQENSELYALQKSVEDAMVTACGMTARMELFAAAHEAIVQENEERLRRLREELHRSRAEKEELSAEASALREELRTICQLVDPNDVEEGCDLSMLSILYFML